MTPAIVAERARSSCNSSVMISDLDGVAGYGRHPPDLVIAEQRNGDELTEQPLFAARSCSTRA